MTEASDTLGVQAETKHAPVVPRPEFVERPLLAADFDGVIVNTLKTLVQIAHRMGKVFPSTVGHTNELAAHGWTADEIDQISNAAYAGDGACYNEPLLGAVDGLKTLEQYFRVVVVTARHGQALVNARIILGNLGLGHLQVVGERHTAAMKASTLEEFGGAFAFVEDSPANLVAALEHTLHAYLVTWPYNTDTWTEHRHMLTELAAHEAWPRLVASLIQRAGIREEAA
jgi:hypothetical protein